MPPVRRWNSLCAYTGKTAQRKCGAPVWRPAADHRDVAPRCEGGTGRDFVIGHPTMHFCSSLPDAIGQHLLSLTPDTFPVIHRRG
jgi:hypothetical protein